MHRGCYIDVQLWYVLPTVWLIVQGLTDKCGAFDQQGFNNTQAMVPFNRTFGVCNAKGECTLPATYLSLIGGVIYAGFALG